MLKGKNAKPNLDLIDKKKLAKLVDQFINDQINELPIVNRSEIKEYLNIMRCRIVMKNHGRPSEYNWTQENSERQIKKLRNLIIQRDNEISLLLNEIDKNKVNKENDFNLYFNYDSDLRVEEG